MSCLEALALGLLLFQDKPGGTGAKPVPAETAAEPETASAAGRKRVELNLLGTADTESGESRRNENVQFNLVDNGALKELNVRLGTTATLIREFQPDRSYFGAEFGSPASLVIHVAPVAKSGWHGQASWSHLNSVFSARSFFQVGPVKPARENDYRFSTGFGAWRGGFLQLDGSQQKMRGNVNGNVLVPRPDERTPLTSDPSLRPIVERYLGAYPKELPNRTDVNPRALNTNSPQTINNSNAGLRLDQELGPRDKLAAQYQFSSQSVDSFQFVTGQYPDTETKSHRARLTWARVWSARSDSLVSAGYDRLGSLLRPPPESIGPMVSTAGLTTFGPDVITPIDRALNHFRYAAEARALRGSHLLTFGGQVLRRQMNGTEEDAHRGYFSFVSDFGADGITNLRLGRPSQHIKAIGNVTRGFRNWESALYAGDTWRPAQRLTVSAGLRYMSIKRPVEVNGINSIPYDSDLNNWAPTLGLAARLPRFWGVLRAAGGVQHGEIFPVTYAQIRFSPPASVKIIVPAPNLANPLPGGAQQADAKGVIYTLDPELTTPYSYQYNASWEPDFGSNWRLQLGYAGSRSHKLLLMWYLNRAEVVPGIPQTTATLNLRRPDQRIADYRLVINGSRGYLDSARVTLLIPRWRGLSADTSYWFSKAIDLGSGYTNTAQDADSRQSRSQSRENSQADMRGLSNFDQPHSFLSRVSYSLPESATRDRWRKLWRGWTVAGVVLLKQGTPFNVISGSDAPGFGNVDANGGDRPNILDPSILGRTIGDPDSSRSLLPRSAFSFMAPTDARGNLGRNSFRKGGIRNVNASLARTWPIFGDKRMTLRAESINLLNTPQFAEPGAEVANPNFGQITNTLNDGRTFRFQIQFGW